MSDFKTNEHKRAVITASDIILKDAGLMTYTDAIRLAFDLKPPVNRNAPSSSYSPAPITHLDSNDYFNDL